MSKTLKTRPLMIKALDPKDHSVALAEEHDHINGVCDLPDRPPKKLDHVLDMMYRPGSCYYTWEYTGTQLCGCRMCTCHDEFRAERRKDRQDTKRELRELQKRDPAELI